ncbi:MAG: hypothetical protein CM1200mP22_02880 [Dehalococcoidia bacterium]|nr:MAG: hypothetical protein CM1200mP22_02880 [Dehalococcoidia bacterium]
MIDIVRRRANIVGKQPQNPNYHLFIKRARKDRRYHGARSTRSTKLYKTMTTIRHFEERGIPETGQRGMSASVHSSAGQEAVPTGMCANLSDDDYIGSTHRGHGHCIAKGVDPKLMMAELFGRATGPNKGKGGSMHILI